MASTWKMTVININSHLNIRNGPSTNYDVVGKRNNGDTFVADDMKTNSNGSIWYKEQGKKRWSCMKTSDGKKYLKAKALETDTQPAFKDTPQMGDVEVSANQNALGVDDIVERATTKQTEEITPKGGLGVPSWSKSEVSYTEDPYEEITDPEEMEAGWAEALASQTVTGGADSKDYDDTSATDDELRRAAEEEVRQHYAARQQAAYTGMESYSNTYTDSSISKSLADLLDSVNGKAALDKVDKSDAFGIRMMNNDPNKQSAIPFAAIGGNGGIAVIASHSEGGTSIDDGNNDTVGGEVEGSNEPQQVGDSVTYKQVWGIKTAGVSGRYMIYNKNVYPKVEKFHTERFEYVSDDGQMVFSTAKVADKHDYSINLSETMVNTFDKIKRNLNAPTAYDRNNLNFRTHSQFNRYHIAFPDLYLRKATCAVFFTRPDLNILKSSVGETNTFDEQIQNDLRLYYTANRHPELAELLSAGGGGMTKTRQHNFNPLLSNLADSMDIIDDTIDTVETGENFVGYKLQYAKHNIKCMTPGTISIKFKETFDLAITNIHQLWVDYMSDVYRGILSPKEEHIFGRELDYMCNVYYFLLGEDRRQILFWAKYYGCFPTTVPKSQYTCDVGSPIIMPDANVTYNYIMKSELDPRILVEFVHDSGAELGDSFETLPNFSDRLSHGGRTWAGIPFISQYSHDVGFGVNSYAIDNGLRLEYRKIGA